MFINIKEFYCKCFTSHSLKDCIKELYLKLHFIILPLCRNVYVQCSPPPGISLKTFLNLMLLKLNRQIFVFFAKLERTYAFATNSDVLIPKSLQPGFDIFLLRLCDLTGFIV